MEDRIVTAPKPGSGARMTAQDIYEKEGWILWGDDVERKPGEVVEQPDYQAGSPVDVGVQLVIRREISRERAMGWMRRTGLTQFCGPFQPTLFYEAVAE